MKQSERFKSFYSRRSVSLTLEGWYYLFVLIFIAGGAILQQVNPLLVLAALMVAPLIFTWRIAMFSINRIRVSRAFPKQISAGEMLTIDLRFVNNRHRFDSHTLRVIDRIALVEPPEKGQVAVTDMFLPRLAVGQSEIISYRAYLSRRGRYRFGPVRFSTRFPTGLVEAVRSYRKTDEITVGPQVGQFTRAWYDLIHQRILGTQQAVNQSGGQDGNFYALRTWRSGDSQRWIHWRSTARSGQLMVKQFEQQSERDFSVILDLWHDDPNNQVQQENVELAASVGATAVLNATRQSAGNVTLAVAGLTSHCLTSQATPNFLAEVINCLAVVQANDRVALGKVLRETLRANGPATPIVVVSTRKLTVEDIIEFAQKTQVATEAGEHLAGFDLDSVRARLILIRVDDRENLETIFKLAPPPLEATKEDSQVETKTKAGTKVDTKTSPETKPQQKMPGQVDQPISNSS